MFGLLLIGGLLLSSPPTTYAQTTPAPAPAADAVMMKGGRMMTVTGGRMAPLTAAMPLANGTTVQPDGKLLLAGGQWMPLHEGEQVKMDGMLVPAPQPRQRRVSRFNKHVSTDMMKRMR